MFWFLNLKRLPSIIQLKKPLGLENLTCTKTNKTEWSVPSAIPDSFFLIKGSYLYLLLLLPEKLLFVYFRLCIFPLDLLLWLLLLLFWIFSFLVLVLLVFKDHLWKPLLHGRQKFLWPVKGRKQHYIPFNKLLLHFHAQRHHFHALDKNDLQGST